MNEWRFRPGKSLLPAPQNFTELTELVEKADPAYWNGATGVSCFSYPSGRDSVHLYVSLAQGANWHLRYQFADNSFVVAHDPHRKDKPPVALWIGGNESVVPADQFVNTATALAIMRQFTADGKPYDMADWRVPDRA